MKELILSEPVVVGCSQENETRWGRFQFPSLFRLPGGELMVTVNDAEDATNGYGRPLHGFTSSDEGRSWRETVPAVPVAGPHATCAEVFDDEYLIVPASEAFDPAGMHLPPPVSRTFAYREILFYRVDQCPAPVRHYLTRLPAWRWSPARRNWEPAEVRYDVSGQLGFRCGNEGTLSRTWFEHAPIRHNGELSYVDYRVNCLGSDGTAPDGCSCLLMVSRDNGRSFQKRSVLASGHVYEPMLAETGAGELVCVIRGADQEQRPMLITHSRDHGWNWEEPRPLFDYGVFPNLVRLGNGVLLLAFGRPGVWVSASLDGGGRHWTGPTPVIDGDARGLMAATCGYTNLLPLGDDEALLVYSDFKHRGADGKLCKAIEVRRIRVAPAYREAQGHSADEQQPQA